MQLGTRWAFGAAAPARLPDAVRTAIRQLEVELGEEATRSWTLTWLEGLPVVTLDPSAEGADGDGEPTIIRYRRDTDTATISAGNSGEEWAED